jgi:hypothetical protein
MLFTRTSWHYYVQNSEYKASRARRDILLSFRLSLAQILPSALGPQRRHSPLSHSVKVQNDKQKWSFRSSSKLAGQK